MSAEDTDTDRADTADTAGKAGSGAARRPNPAASAASRARRIGGATTTRTTPALPAEDVVEPAPDTARSRRWSRKAIPGSAPEAEPVPATKPAAATRATAAPKAASTKAASTKIASTKPPMKPGAQAAGAKPAAAKPAGAKAAAGKAAAGKAAAGKADTATDGVSMRKRQPRATSARDLKAAAAEPAPVAEIPAWLRWVPATVLSVCALAMIVIIAVAAHGVWYAEPSTAGTRDKVLAAAKKCTATANTYNYKTLAADEKRGLACTTGAWTAQYRSALEKIVKPTAVQLKASQAVTINDAGIESASDNGKQWTTVIYGQLTINQANATPRIDQFAAVVRMDKVKSSYLVSKIDLVTSGTG